MWPPFRLVYGVCARTPTLWVGSQLTMSVSDGVPVINVEQVCQGIAEQGGVTFHDPGTARAKKECVESEHEVSEKLPSSSPRHAPR